VKTKEKRGKNASLKGACGGCPHALQSIAPVHFIPTTAVVPEMLKYTCRVVLFWIKRSKKLFIFSLF